jgi:hypothetical protein
MFIIVFVRMFIVMACDDVVVDTEVEAGRGWRMLSR